MKKKTVVSVIAVAMLFAVSLYFVGGTYARYAGEFTGDASVEIAKWAVKVNDSDETTMNLEFKVTGNENVVENKIAPSVVAKSTAKLDLTNTEVAVELIVEKGDEFDTKITQLGLEADQIKFVVKLADGNTVKVTEGSGVERDPYIIPLQSNTAFTSDNGIFNIELEVEWENDDNKNDKDTTVGKTGGTLTLPIKLSVQQHIDKV